MNSPSMKNFQGIDPQTFVNAIRSLVVVTPVTFASATQTIATVPANSIILDRYIARTTAWDAITTFEIGKSGDTDWLATTAEANVDGSIESGEQGAVEIITGGKVVTSDTDIILTLNQGGATAGVGYVVVEYMELAR